jgi:hypothetical protein
MRQCAAKDRSKAHQGRLLQSFSHHKVAGYASYCTSMVLHFRIECRDLFGIMEFVCIKRKRVGGRIWKYYIL